jgi:hypothetical protein
MWFQRVWQEIRAKKCPIMHKLYRAQGIEDKSGFFHRTGTHAEDGIGRAKTDEAGQ